MTTIEADIKKIIEEVICGKYIGKLKVVKEDLPDGVFWMLLLYLNLEMSPMILAYEGTEEQFKEFIRTEIKAKKLHEVSFWKATQEHLSDYETDDDYE